jgi:hypothetical protein
MAAKDCLFSTKANLCGISVPRRCGLPTHVDGVVKPFLGRSRLVSIGAVAPMMLICVRRRFEQLAETLGKVGGCFSSQYYKWQSLPSCVRRTVKKSKTRLPNSRHPNKARTSLPRLVTCHVSSSHPLIHQVHQFRP